MKHIKVTDLRFEPQAGSERALVLDERDFGLNLKAQVIRVEAGQKLRPHMHKVRTEMVQVLSGNGDIIVNGKPVTGVPGEFVLVKPGEPHTVINKGSQKFVLMLLTANDPGPEDMIWVDEEENDG